MKQLENLRNPDRKEKSPYPRSERNPRFLKSHHAKIKNNPLTGKVVLTDTDFVTFDS